MGCIQAGDLFLDSRARSEFKAAARCKKLREDQVHAIQVMIRRTVPHGQVKRRGPNFTFRPRLSIRPPV